ncbi:hypothetical protein [Ktedonobacter sp. SOSP1-52]|uniref:hypothetical protein n=1 Tax=Ktedonobacter sp. SOSP1-52 TaxID=2778366 RepID=UPI0019168437|nr:hypothetical protein [Ktedonobacter sp. SOSP1-52]
MLVLFIAFGLFVVGLAALSAMALVILMHTVSSLAHAYQAPSGQMRSNAATNTTGT